MCVCVCVCLSGRRGVHVDSKYRNLLLFYLDIFSHIPRFISFYRVGSYPVFTRIAPSRFALYSTYITEVCFISTITLIITDGF